MTAFCCPTALGWPSWCDRPSLRLRVVHERPGAHGRGARRRLRVRGHRRPAAARHPPGGHRSAGSARLRAGSAAPATLVDLDHRLRRGPVDWGLAAGLVMTSGGLALFLVAARPSPGEDALTVGDVIPLAAVLAVLIVGSLALAAWYQGTVRALALALATGIVYGVTAAVAKVTLGVLDEGLSAVLTHWSLWAVVVLGPFGFLLNQHAFHESALASPVVAVITVADPLVGIGIGILWLGESVPADGPAVLTEVLGLLVMAAGVWLVAHRSPHLSGAKGSGARAAGRSDR